MGRPYRANPAVFVSPRSLSDLTCEQALRFRKKGIETAMAEKFVNVDRNTPMLLPPDLRDWVPSNHIVHFIIEALDGIEATSAKVNVRGSGSAQYPPRLMLGLLIYGYATGRFSSREIERATHTDVAMRYLAADKHPDHDTLCAFRRNNAPLVREIFTAVLLTAQELKLLKVGNISIDGTKIQANASKHKAISHKRACEQIELLESEVSQLMLKAEAADNKDLADGFTLPGEIALRQHRLKKLQQARKNIEERLEEQRQQKQAEYEQNLAERAENKAKGKWPRTPPAKPPSATPSGKEQENFTDPESRIMKVGNGGHFEQSYNAQGAVDADGSLLILGARVTNRGNDKQELEPTVASIPQALAPAQTVLCDSGFYSEKQVAAVEAGGVTTVYAAVRQQKHRRSLADLAPHQEPEPLGEKAKAIDIMAHRLKTAVGKSLYGKRKQTVEPVFGIIKETMGFRRFSLRGLSKVNLEWDLVCLAYNFKRLFRLHQARTA